MPTAALSSRGARIAHVAAAACAVFLAMAAWMASVAVIPEVRYFLQ